MTFTENISQILTNKITSELDYDETRKEIIAYSIENFVLAFFGFAVLIIVGYSLKVLEPTILAASFGSLLRRVSGGAHLSDPIRCTAFGTVSYCVIGFVAGGLVNNPYYNYQVYSVCALIVSFLLVSFLAPVDSESKPIRSKSLRFNLRIASILFVLGTIFMVIISHNKALAICATLGVLYQCITLLPIFNKRR
jgi:accessory gene regulator B